MISDAVPDTYLHSMFLVAGRPDRPAQSGQKYRMCTDFRLVDCLTQIDPYPAPDLYDCIRRVQSATCFCTLDLKTGFHNVLVEPDSQRCTGFVT